MPITLDAELLSSMATNEKALSDGQALVKRRAFNNVQCTEDRSLYWGECQGSGAKPYKLSLDLDTGGEKPTGRCDCPSRVRPCKHILGLLSGLHENSIKASVGKPAQDLLDKREKLQDRNAKQNETPPATAEETAPSGDAAAAAKLEAKREKEKAKAKAAQTKKLEGQKEALDTLEQFVLDLVSTGLGALNAKNVNTIEEQSKRMGDAALNGARYLLVRLAALAAQRDERPSGRKSVGGPGLDNEERQARMAALVTQLWVAIRKGRKVLEGRLEEGDTQSDADAQVEQLLGRVWKLPELKEAGYWVTQRKVIELAHERVDDDVIQMAEARGWLLDLADGSIPVERTPVPYVALSAGGARLRASRSGVLLVKEAALYPGDVVNRRIRWDEKSPETAPEETPRTAETYARIHSLAKDLEPCVKTFREQLKNLLSPTEAVFFVAVKQFGIGEGDQLVMEDRAGARLAFRDPPDTQFATTNILRYAAGAFGPGSLAVRLWFDPRERAIYGQALALFVGEQHLRLGL